MPPIAADAEWCCFPLLLYSSME